MRIEGGRLLVAGRDAEALAREHGTPLYVFDLRRIGEQAGALRAALVRAGLTPRVRLAMKALRDEPVLRYLRGLAAPPDPARRFRRPAVGLDACSPGEVEHALACGFLPEEISYTGTNVSERDLDVFALLDVHLNVDLVSQIERVGRRCPGRAIGLRINPRAGVMRGHAQSLYAGDKPTKFGIYEEDLDRALAAAERHALTDRHRPFPPRQRDARRRAPRLRRGARRGRVHGAPLDRAGCPLEEVNVGGGLGTPLHEGERPLDLDAYAGLIARHFGDLGVAIGAEPGEFLTNEAGVLLAEVVTVEDRAGTPFVGLDCGWNVLNDHRIYGRELEFVLPARAQAPPTRFVTVAGAHQRGRRRVRRGRPPAGCRRGRDRRQR